MTFLKTHYRTAVLVLLLGTASAQDRPTPPQPAPEHQRLGYFVGTWRTEGEMRGGDFGPGGKFTSTDRGEWLDGGFFVVTRATSTLPTGSQFQLSVIGWDPRQRVYTFSSFNSAGIRTSATGVIDGNRWTWTTAEAPGGLHVRHTITMVSSSEYTFVFETSFDGSTWSTFIQGRTTKVQ